MFAIAFSCLSFSSLVTARIPAGAITPRSDVDNSTLPSTAIEVGATPWIDPNFSIASEYGMPTLPGIPCLMNAVNAMQDLALEDFVEPLIPITYILDDFPEVMIAPEATAVGGAIQSRFIIWGLWLGVQAMMDRGIFHTAVFTLKYHGVVVGYVKFVQRGARLTDVGSNDTHTLTQTSVYRDGISPATGTSILDVDDQQLTASFNPIGPPLSGSDVLMAILYGLMYAARFPKTARAEPFKLSIPAPFKAMHVDIFRLSAPAPPFLEYRWIIMSLSQIPQYMLQRRKFSGVSMKIRIGRVTVGQGSISRKTAERKPSR